jgi:pimeloyl-ACP methyl ester carboxylesterase
VFSPSHTGLGERRHLLSPSINLGTHVQDVMGILRSEELDGVVLCGHSCGGVEMPAAAELEWRRIKALVYLDALLVADGESAFDVLPSNSVAALSNATAIWGDGWLAPPPPASAYDANLEDRAWVDRHADPHPMACLRQPVRLGEGLASLTDKTFIYASGWGPTTSVTASYERARLLNWRTSEVACGHDVMVAMPEAVVSDPVAAAERPCGGGSIRASSAVALSGH